MIYDTTSQWSSVVTKKASAGLSQLSDYDPNQSNTSVPLTLMYPDGPRHEQASLVFGNITLGGLKYNETMCLKQSMHESERLLANGRLCVQNLTLVVTDIITGPFKANGVVGLAPS